MLNINKVRKAQQGQLLNAKGLEYKQSTIPATIDFNLEIQGLKTNPYMKSNSNPTLVNQNLYNTLGQGIDFMGSTLFSNKDGYNGTYGSLQQGGDQAFDQASNTIMSINPLVGGIMKAGGLASDILTTYGGMGTDSMTRTDAILGSKLQSLTPWGMINGFFGKKTKDFSINQDTLSQVGGDFTGSTKDILNAKDKANKKYGLFSNRARQKANSQIQDAQIQQNKMTEIANESRDLQSIASNMSDLNSLNYLQKINGGIDFRYTRAAKSGTKLSRIKKLQLHKIGGIINQSINVDTKEIEDTWVPIIEILQEGGEINKYRTLNELIEYAKQQNPRFIQRLSEPPKGIDFIDDDGKQSRGSHYLEWGTDDKGNAIIYPRIQEINGKLKFFNPADAYNRAIENNNYLIMTPEEAKIFFAEDDKYGTAYKSGWPEFFNSFKNGGKTISKEEESPQKNVIPEGALHKNKHHMENAENLTQKGIPVIDNEGEQQAEIEKNEIIFTLEVTTKLEELMKDGSDEAAIEAGKLLVEQILFNTDDRTGLINTLKQGGKINEVS